MPLSSGCFYVPDPDNAPSRVFTKDPEIGVGFSAACCILSVLCCFAEISLHSRRVMVKKHADGVIPKWLHWMKALRGHLMCCAGPGRRFSLQDLRKLTGNCGLRGHAHVPHRHLLNPTSTNVWRNWRHAEYAQTDRNISRENMQDTRLMEKPEPVSLEQGKLSNCAALCLHLLRLSMAVVRRVLRFLQQEVGCSASDMTRWVNRQLLVSDCRPRKTRRSTTSSSRATPTS